MPSIAPSYPLQNTEWESHFAKHQTTQVWTFLYFQSFGLQAFTERNKAMPQSKDGWVTAACHQQMAIAATWMVSLALGMN